MNKPRRVRVDLFAGKPPYDKRDKNSRVAFWLIRCHPEKKGESWLVSFYRREEGRRDYEGTGWENAAVTLLGEHYAFAQANYDKYVQTMKMLEPLPSKMKLSNPGFRPVTVKVAIGQVRAEWQKFVNSFTSRMNHDLAALQEGGWPLPEAWPLPWEN